MKTRTEVMNELLESASDSLSRKQPEEACSIIAAYEALHRCETAAVYAASDRVGRPAGLDSGAALREPA